MAGKWNYYTEQIKLNSIGKTGGKGNTDGFSLNEHKREDAANRNLVRVSPASCRHGDAVSVQTQEWRRKRTVVVGGCSFKSKDGAQTL